MKETRAVKNTHWQVLQRTRRAARSRALTWFVFVSGSACSSIEFSTQQSEDPAPIGAAATPAASLAQALTVSCSLDTVGLPCDPDGAGPASECEGLCWVGTSRTAECLSVELAGFTLEDLNGRICGDASGSSCGKSCENGQCVPKNARLGTACRPLGQGNTCDGLCTLLAGAPTCDTVTACSDVGVRGCLLRACDLGDNTTASCVDYPLGVGTRCDDGDACTTQDVCDGAGQCESGADRCVAEGGAGGIAGSGGESAGGEAGSPASSGSAGVAQAGGAPQGGAEGEAGSGGDAPSPQGGKAGEAGAAGSAGHDGTSKPNPPAAKPGNSEISGGGCQFGTGRQPYDYLVWLSLAALATRSRSRRARRSSR